jgi:hypothetical protein
MRPRAAAAVVDGLVARDCRGARAHQLEWQRKLRCRCAEQRQRDLGAHVVRILGLDAGAAQLSVHGAAHASARDRIARIARQRACGSAQAEAHGGSPPFLHGATVPLG